MVSCATIEPATSYHFVPRNGQVEEIGKVTYVIETSGYSIITVENLISPIYVEGKLPIDIPSDMMSYVWKESNDRYHFVYDHKRYLIDNAKTEL